ncbi:MAG: (2Fe-2S)-binding protein [Bacteroidetes Order II. Incertae sedis bacterium]|nr:(2Fe-2S)-binding protein [Bacteroidetes Order II. bacterium]MBT6200820.1 (2Fe-2S)-binding protein [Bacteroidetes Order II. bacterium]MBT6425435.1 (2Fe-2S)-binding protein [Bacteroidetes Order II. bacterium]MBT6581285.1 (2Fe-2S)-binding protein [Bacteroidetes Order II. bacterium]MBT7400679.1 (2Fe-2S)-binding protein [Bacteroidetes Order II. bacterium]
MAIKSCICSNVSFVELKAIADQKKVKSIYEIQQDRPFGRSCKLCIPYVRQMLKDGRTSFDEVITE